MDPLSVLRDYTLRGELDTVVLERDDIRFGDKYRFPKDAKTAYKSGKGFYTLEALLFFARNLTVERHTDYMKLANAAKVPNVSLVDRKDLTAYLKGEIDTCDAIDIIAPSFPSAPSSAVAAVGSTAAAVAAGIKEETDARFGKRKEGAEAADGASRKKTRAEEQDIEAKAGKDSSGPDNVLRQLLERERLVRDRGTILLSHKRTFESVLALMTKREEVRKRENGAPAPATDEKTKDQDGRYTTGQEPQQFWKGYLQNDDAEALGIDTTATTDTFTTEKKPSRPGESQHRSRADQKPGSLRLEGPPIILVPNASATLLNIFNARDFLEDGKYVPWEEKQFGMSVKPSVVDMVRKQGRTKPVHYKIMNVPPKKEDKHEWKRVVACFVVGKKWQFAGWPWENPSDIFHNVRGFFLRFDEDKHDELVQQWNVKIISLSKNNRHRDSKAALDFWNVLDSFVGSKKSEKPGLVY